MATDVLIKYELDIGPPLETEILDYAEKHLNEHLDTRVAVLSELRDLIFERGECTPHRTDDDFLLRFLRARKFVVRHAHRLMVKYYNYKENYPELFENICVKRWMYMCNLNIVSVLPFVEETGRRVGIYRPALWNPDEVSAEELMKYALLMLEMYLINQKAVILGGIGIFDLEGISMKHLLQLTPRLINIMSNVLWSFPLRGHQLHVVNHTSVFTAGYALARPFLNNEMKGKLVFHGTDMASLHKYIEPKYLPERYGGVHKDFNCTEWIRHIKSNKPLLDELAVQGYDIAGQLDAEDDI